jgi:hypothetical protein
LTLKRKGNPRRKKNTLPVGGRQRRKGEVENGAACDGRRPLFLESGTDRAQRVPHRGLIFASDFSLGLRGFFEVKLADHVVQVAGEQGKILQSFHGFLGALRIFCGQLGDMSG